MKWNYFSASRHLKLLLQHLLRINQGVQNWFSKQEMKLSQQEMELSLPFLGLKSKNFFHKIFFIFDKEIKIDCWWEIEFFKQEMELFLHFPGFWSKYLYYKMFLIFKKMEWSNQDMESHLPLPGLWSKFFLLWLTHRPLAWTYFDLYAPIPTYLDLIGSLPSLCRILLVIIPRQQYCLFLLSQQQLGPAPSSYWCLHILHHARLPTHANITMGRNTIALSYYLSYGW